MSTEATFSGAVGPTRDELASLRIRDTWPTDIPDDIRRNAVWWWNNSIDNLEGTARAIMAERERCAAICDAEATEWNASGDNAIYSAVSEAAAAIRKGEA